MGLVGLNQVPAISLPVNATTADADQVRANDVLIRAKMNAHDADPTIHVQTTVLADRPGFGVAGRLWFTTDTRQLWYDNGSAWVQIAYAPSANPTFTGVVTLPDTVTINGVAYEFPATAPAGVLTSDGAGGLTFANPLPSVFRSRRGSMTTGGTFILQFSVAGVDVGDATNLIPHSTTTNNTRFGSVDTQGAIYLVTLNVQDSLSNAGNVNLWRFYAKLSDGTNFPSNQFAGGYSTSGGKLMLSMSFLVPQGTADYFQLYGTATGSSMGIDYEAHITRIA